MSNNTFHYGEDYLTIGTALDISSGKTKGILCRKTLEKVKTSRNYVNNIVHKKKVVYGINTGFGPLCTTLIGEEDTKKLQHNLLKSHSVGVGNIINDDIARLMLILKVHSLAKAYSGISHETLERIIWHIEEDIIPCVPEQGSVGASGDLAPLAHLFLPLIGLGEVRYQGEKFPTQKLFDILNIEPIDLGPKEGLALINGTQFISAHTVKFIERYQNCLDHADIIAAMNLEAMMGSVKSFDEELHTLRPYAGNSYVARRMRALLKDSEIVESHKNCTRVQDPYSLRCIPQVHGASRNAWLHLKEMLQIEINSVTDNPIIFNEEKTISGGNFHGQPIALPIDYAALSASELGNISDRRVYLSLMEKVEGLPKLLMSNTGLNSGFMIPQYTTAALVSENKSLCFPASADSIPTSLGQEDHVSMGSISSRKALQIVANLEKILAIELFTSAQGFDFRKPLKSGILIDKCHQFIRTKIDFAENDRIFAEDINEAIKIITNKELTSIIDKEALKNQIDIKNSKDEIFGIY
ncbi:MAG: histidine ammonia-lyase [Bacteroidales bacterium]|nr:histidine ammonia-lyase [Bacteroidales bacterium]MBN2818374.1 histidine ammonia-lyase [Bacteroidales bacterium]